MTTALDHSPAASSEDGLARSARMLISLGDAAEDVLARLQPGEAETLRQEMQRLSAQNANSEDRVWERFDALPVGALIDLLRSEPPMVRAVLASRLSEEKGAELLAALPEDEAMELVLRLVRQGPVPPAVEQLVAETLAARLERPGANISGLARAGALMSRLPDTLAGGLLRQIEANDPDTADRLRRERLTFDELARLDAASIDALLAAADRDGLARALKAAPGPVKSAIRARLTERARADLEARAGALPSDRSSVEAARAELMRLVHALIREGSIARPAFTQQA